MYIIEYIVAFWQNDILICDFELFKKCVLLRVAAVSVYDSCVFRKWRVAMQPDLVTFSGQASFSVLRVTSQPVSPFVSLWSTLLRQSLHIQTAGIFLKEFLTYILL